MTNQSSNDLTVGISMIKDTILEGYSNRNQVLILANLVLMISENYLPTHLKDNAISLLSDGRSVAYEKLSLPNDVGLNLAAAAHQLIRQAENI